LTDRQMLAVLNRLFSHPCIEGCLDPAAFKVQRGLFHGNLGHIQLALQPDPVGGGEGQLVFQGLNPLPTGEILAVSLVQSTLGGHVLAGQFLEPIDFCQSQFHIRCGQLEAGIDIEDVLRQSGQFGTGLANAHLCPPHGQLVVLGSMVNSNAPDLTKPPSMNAGCMDTTCPRTSATNFNASRGATVP
jgi:hypothetical protein